jgi:hypothetical protein
VVTAALVAWWLPRVGSRFAGAPSPQPATTPSAVATPASAPPSDGAPPVVAEASAAPEPARPAPREASPSRRDRDPLPDPPAGPERDPAPAPEPEPTPDLRQQAEDLARHRDAARSLEAREEWRAAVGEYDAALAIDAHVSFAIEGRLRAVRRAALSDALDRHVASPQRLSAEPVAREAEALVERARGEEPAGPRLEGQIRALEQALGAARTTVAVVIESDGLTEVSVSRVGPLGRMTRRTLELRPGEYTAVGSREGYRDVRRRFSVSPGGPSAPVVVRCEEAL